MEPLESTAIHLIQRSVLRFIRMLPAGRVSERDIAEYNEQQMQDMVQIRDFLVLHYKVTNRSDSPFWRHCAAMPNPAKLAQKTEPFSENESRRAASREKVCEGGTDSVGRGTIKK